MSAVKKVRNLHGMNIRRLSYGTRSLIHALIIFFAGAGLVSYFSYYSNRAVGELEKSQFEYEAQLIYLDVENQINLRMRSLEGLQALLRNGSAVDYEAFDLTAHLLNQAFPNLVSINLIDRSRVIVRVWPIEENLSAIGRVVGETESVLNGLTSSRENDQVYVTPLVDIFQGGSGIVSYYPIYLNGQFAGYLNAVLRIEDFRDALGKALSGRFEIKIISSQEADADAQLQKREGQTGLTALFPVRIKNQEFKLSVKRFVDNSRRSELYSDLIWGFLISLLCAASVAVVTLLNNRVQRLNAMLSGILKTAPTAIIALDPSRKITVFNPSAEAMFLRSSGEMIGQTLDVLIPQSLRDLHKMHIEGFSKNSEFNKIMGDWRKIRGIRSNGQEFPVLVSIGKSYFESGEILTAVLRDMTDEEASQAEILKLAQEKERQAALANAANQAKTMFLAMMSHELRTPLNAIIGFSEIMNAEVFGPINNKKYKEYSEDIYKSGTMLLELIGDILDLSKTEVGAYQYQLETISIEAVIKDCTRMMLPLAKEKTIQIRYLENQRDCAAHVDERAIKQVLINLLSNAIKFTGGGGQIEVGAESDPINRTISIWVADNGIGISNEDLKSIGEPFVQVRNSYVSNDKGTGLGLAISRKLLEGMGGKMHITSKIGLGTKVTIVFSEGSPDQK